jgi:hypothetical protein
MRVMRWWGHTQDRTLKDVPPLASGMRLLFRGLCRDMLRRERGWERGRFTVPPELLRHWNATPSG